MLYKPLMHNVLRRLTEPWSLVYSLSHFSNLQPGKQTSFSAKGAASCTWAVHIPGFLSPSLSLPRRQANGIPSGRVCMESNSKTYNWQFFHLSKAFSIVMMLLSDLLWFSQSVASPPRLLLGYGGYHNSRIHRQKERFSSSLQISLQFLLCFSSGPTWRQKMELSK